MAGWRTYVTLQTLNVLTFLWFTALNVFAFSLSFGLRDPKEIDPPEEWKYGYGIGKETLLTPSPWIYVVLFAVHILFAGTVAFAQFSEKGKDIIVGALNIRWPILMLLSTAWTATWLRQWYIFSWILAILVAALASNTSYVVRRRYRLEHELEAKDEFFVYLPFSLYHGWTLFIVAVNTFAAFAPLAVRSGTLSKVFAVWILAALSGAAHLNAFSTRSGDLPATLVLALGQFAIFGHQLPRTNSNGQHLVAWFAFAFAIVSLLAFAKSVWGTVHVIRNRGGGIRLEVDHEAEPAS